MLFTDGLMFASIFQITLIYSASTFSSHCIMEQQTGITLERIYMERVFDPFLLEQPTYLR